MEFKVIEDDALAEELLNERETNSPYPEIVQVGPLRWYDKEMRCASKGCSAPTYMRLQGIQYCWVHAIRKMNVMLNELGITE